MGINITGRSGQISIRSADRHDQQSLARFLNSESYIHRHLDWRAPLDWLGQRPFLIAEHDQQIRGVLACPPDPNDIAWIRLFAASNFSRSTLWDTLLGNALIDLESEFSGSLAAIALHKWFEELLKRGGFSQTQEIVVLEWNGIPPPEKHLPPSLIIRQMISEDMEQVHEIDGLAFDPLWRNSSDTLFLAYEQSTWSTVAESEDRIVGYQISSAVSLNGHLARLAVHPSCRGKNIGYELVRDVLLHFVERGAWRVTVNTQSDNLASLALYQKIGFRQNGEVFPVYVYPLNSEEN